MHYTYLLYVEIKNHRRHRDASGFRLQRMYIDKAKQKKATRNREAIHLDCGLDIGEIMGFGYLFVYFKQIVHGRWPQYSNGCAEKPWAYSKPKYESRVTLNSSLDVDEIIALFFNWSSTWYLIADDCCLDCLGLCKRHYRQNRLLLRRKTQEKT